MKGQFSRFFLALLWAALIVESGLADPLLTVPLRIKGHDIRAEVAHTPDARARGLMHRKTLPENQGMLFVYPEPGPHAMWMMNTALPLSVAFIDAEGVILNIRTMTPLSSDSHTAAGDAAYSLEMNAGWFERRGIKKGDRVEGFSQAPAGK